MENDSTRIHSTPDDKMVHQTETTVIVCTHIHHGQIFMKSTILLELASEGITGHLAERIAVKLIAHFGRVMPDNQVFREGNAVHFDLIENSFDWQSDGSNWKKMTTTEVMNILGISAHPASFSKELSLFAGKARRSHGKNLRLIPPLKSTTAS
jgi:hypothetical protein